MKKICILGLAIFALVFLTACTGSDDDVITDFVEGAFIVYESVDELASVATDIVRVEILDEWVEWRNVVLPPRDEDDEYLNPGGELIEQYEISTIHQLRVLDVFQGNAQVGDIMEVAQLGGRIDNRELVNANFVSFAAGDDVVLFLRTFYFDEERPAVLLGPMQSVYRVSHERGDGAMTNDSSDAILENINPDNDLSLTFGDLERIRGGGNLAY